MKSKKINCGITGHTGSLGSELLKKNIGVKFIKFKGDITNKKHIKKWFQNYSIDIIIHLAAVVPTRLVKKNYRLANKVNFYGTKLLVDEVIKYKKIKWFFYSSTSHVYKFSNKKLSENSIIKPISKYGLTKLKGENYIKKKLKKKIPFCIGRIFSFTSTNQSKDYIIPSILDKAQSKKKIILFNNVNHYRDFLSINDICRAISILMRKRATGIYNIGSGNKILISNIIKIIFKKFNKKYFFKETSKSTCLVCNNSKMKKLNWKPKKNIQSILTDLF